MNSGATDTATLVAQQQALAAVIRGDGSLADTLLQATPQGSPPRVSIYSVAYRARLGEALKENFPVLASVLGDDGFVDLCNAFLDTYPSRTPSIRWFGIRLSEFVMQHPDQLPHPALLDLIKMEWALNTSFDATDATSLKIDDILALKPDAWPELKFDIHPSVRLLALGWNVEPLWSALTADENAETAPPEEFAHHLLIWRVEHHNQWRSVASEEAMLLDALMDGSDFTELCEVAVGFAGDNAAGTTAGYLRNWVESGLLAGFKS